MRQEVMDNSRILILIIGGEPDLREGLASALSKAGFTVADVPDYHEALMKLGEFTPNIAILDETLPSGDGKEACYKLTGDFGIPAILLGEDSSSHAYYRAVEAGADVYLRKPVHHQELAARVKAILRRYKR